MVPLRRPARGMVILSSRRRRWRAAKNARAARCAARPSRRIRAFFLGGFDDGERHSAPQSSSIPQEAKPVTFPVALLVVAVGQLNSRRSSCSVGRHVGEQTRRRASVRLVPRSSVRWIVGEMSRMTPQCAARCLSSLPVACDHRNPAQPSSFEARDRGAAYPDGPGNVSSNPPSPAGRLDVTESHTSRAEGLRPSIFDVWAAQCFVHFLAYGAAGTRAWSARARAPRPRCPSRRWSGAPWRSRPQR